MVAQNYSLILVVVVAAYAAAVVAGSVARDNRLGAAELALIGISVLGVVATFFPQMISRIKLIELGSSVKLELLELKNTQTDQQRALDELTLVLSILLPKAEQDHLSNLLLSQTAEYVGRFAVRIELGHLQSLNLIGIRPNQSLETLAGGRVVDLVDYVELTPLGAKAAQLIQMARRARTLRQPTDRCVSRPVFYSNPAGQKKEAERARSDPEPTQAGNGRYPSGGGLSPRPGELRERRPGLAGGRRPGVPQEERCPGRPAGGTGCGTPPFSPPVSRSASRKRGPMNRPGTGGPCGRKPQILSTTTFFM